MMKRLILLIFISFSALSAQAEEQTVSVELGSASGKTTWTTTDSSLSDFNGQLDHDLTGSAFNIVYTKVKDNNLIWGLGYHSYKIEGTSPVASGDYIVSGTTYPTTIKYGTTLTISGLFAMVGYNLGIGDSFQFLPQVRLGLGNTAKLDTSVDITLAGNSSSGTDSESVSGNTLIIALPFVYKMDDWRFGLQLQSIGAEFTLEYPGEKTVSTLDSAFLLSAGKSF